MPRFSTLPPEVLEHVAYHLALLNPLGPPAHLVPLLSTSKRIYLCLSSTRNVHLYARIFRALFDSRAPRRRQPHNVPLAFAHAAQLVAYSRALNHFRRGDISSPTLLADLYTAFVLCVENDGRNAAHLEWAGVPDYLERYILHRLWAGREDTYNWPVENAENAFALWVYWLTLTPQRLASHSDDHRACLQYLVRPYAVYNFRYPPFLAPDNHFHFPLSAAPDTYRDHSALTPHGSYPQYREPGYVQHTFPHYAHSITIAEPPIGLVAKLIYVALLEHQSQEYPADLIPADRAEADQLGVGGPTVADYVDFGELRAARPPARGMWISDHDDEGEPGRERAEDGRERAEDGPSAQQEDDWARWTGCYNPWDGAVRSRRPAYTPGSLDGMWAGRFLDPDIDDHLRAVHSSTFTRELEAPLVSIASNPVYFTLREHHCVSPARALPTYRDAAGGAGDLFDEGIMNAYLPRDFPGAYAVHADRHEGTLRIRRRAGGAAGEEYVYDTFGAGRDARDGRGTEEREVTDVIVTGETPTKYARAWRDFRIYGRVRPWDGLVVLVRAPVPDPGLGLDGNADGEGTVARDDTYVFRGYVVGGRTIVGAWRHITDSVHSIPVEGPFVVGKVAALGEAERGGGGGGGV